MKRINPPSQTKFREGRTSVARFGEGDRALTNYSSCLLKFINAGFKNLEKGAHQRERHNSKPPPIAVLLIALPGKLAERSFSDPPSFAGRVSAEGVCRGCLKGVAEWICFSLSLAARARSSCADRSGMESGPEIIFSVNSI